MESYQGTYYSKQSCLAWSLGTGCCLTEQSEINVIRFEGAGLDGNIVCGSVYYIFTNHSHSFAYERTVHVSQGNTKTLLLFLVVARNYHDDR